MIIDANDLIRMVEERDAQLRERAHAMAESEGEPLTILQQYGTWAVTDYGVECLEHYYPIEKKRLHDDSWTLHMAEKNWVDMYDFLRAFYAGRCYHYPKRYRHPYDTRAAQGGG